MWRMRNATLRDKYIGAWIPDEDLEPLALHTRAVGDGTVYEMPIAVRERLGGYTIDFKNLDMLRYKMNPVVLWGHNSWTTPIGKGEGATPVRLENGRLIARWSFAKDDEYAAKIENLFIQKVVRAASIGVDEDKDGEQTLLEWSLVTLPMDKDCVVREYRRWERSGGGLVVPSTITQILRAGGAKDLDDEAHHNDQPDDREKALEDRVVSRLSDDLKGLLATRQADPPAGVGTDDDVNAMVQDLREDVNAAGELLKRLAKKVEEEPQGSQRDALADKVGEMVTLLRDVAASTAELSRQAPNTDPPADPPPGDPPPTDPPTDGLAEIRALVEALTNKIDDVAAELKTVKEQRTDPPPTDPPADPPPTDPPAQTEEQIRAAINGAADEYKELLGESYDASKAKTVMDVLRAAAGDEITGDRDEVYLRGALDQIKQRRADAGGRPPNPSPESPSKRTAPVDIMELRRMRRAEAALTR